MSSMPAPKKFSLVEALSVHPYFRSLPARAIRDLSQQAVKREYQPGEIIFLEGDPSAGLWVIEEGHVKIYKLSTDGREHILLMLGPGDAFNEVPAFDGKSNAASTAALSRVTVWVIDSDHVQALVQGDHDIALGIIVGLSARLRVLVQRMEDLTLYAVPVRLARYLLTAPDEEEGITRAAIAAHLATTPETVSRALRALEDAGAIRYDRHEVIIIDEDKLRSLAMV